LLTTRTTSGQSNLIFDIRPHRRYTRTVWSYSPGGINVQPTYRKPKNGCHVNVSCVQGIGNICILPADHSDSLHNQLPSRYRSHKASYSNFSPKIGCHGNNRSTFDLDYIFFG